jgi:undecaprenyl-diphosphatase
MAWWEALVLGVVQGLTEFFPVSSSGHLVMTERLLGLSLPGVTFDVALHVATLLSVLIVYRARILGIVRGLIGAGERNEWPYLLKLALASIPAAIVGILFKDWFEARFDDAVFAGTMVLVTGSFVWSSRWTRLDERHAPAHSAAEAAAAHTARRQPPPLEFLPILIAAAIALWAGTIIPFLAVLGTEAVIMGLSRVTAAKEWKHEPTWSGAAAMGVAQAVAILPGISRSGSTVITGLWRRIDGVAAAEFSFLMSVPAILGAGVLSLRDLGGAEAGASVGAANLVVGALAAGIAGIVAIRFFVGMLKRRSFHAFAYYCWLVGALFIVYVR